MNTMYLCMGRMLDVYYDVSLELSKTHPNNKSMFYISDKKHFSKEGCVTRLESILFDIVK